jgi:hypothetical protein
MSIDCRLETEDGEAVETLRDPRGVLNQLIPPLADTRFHCWRFIDPYGDTVFNGMQMSRFIEELAIIIVGGVPEEASGVLDELGRLAARCRREPHLYLKFYGD